MARRMVLGLLLVTSGMLAGMVLTGRMRSAGDTVALPSRAPAAQPTAATRPAAGPGVAVPDFTEVARRTVGGVTNISSLQVVRAPASPFGNDPFFRYFFGDDSDMFGYRERRGQSAGSGVVVSADGYILTNNHVVGEHMRQVTVVLGDRREREARLVGVDPMTDLAVLKVEGRKLPAIPWGDSSELRVAEWVLAIGNPFQLSQTVTLGIVSALGRTNLNVAGYEDFIQTDAAINPGNSGGALINRRGQLVGINTAIYSQSGGYQGIGFAVPSNLARRVMDDVVRYGEVRRGSIGAVRTVSITEELAAELGLRSTRGALVWEMSRSSSAYEAGIRPGDVIETFNGQPVEDGSHLVRLVADAPVGATASIGVRREGRAFEVKVPISRATTRRRAV